MNNRFLVNSRIRIREDIVTHIKRSLPVGKGKINVLAGQEVSPGDILGEGQEVAGFYSIALSRELGVAPGKVSEFLKYRIGQTVYRGELLASRNELWGIRKKMILSPSDGVLDFYDDRTGVLRIRALPKNTKLVSGVYGIVDRIDTTQPAVLIRTKVSLVYGILGRGRERSGTLKVLDSSDILVGTRQILPGDRGCILVGGSHISLEAIEQAITFNVPGIISGGINLIDYKKMTGSGWEVGKQPPGDVGISLFISEGFGAISIGDDIFPLLKKHDNKFAILDGNRAQLVLPSDDPGCMIDIRKAKPETMGEKAPEPQVQVLEKGMMVRVVSSPFIGRQGEVEAVDQTPTRLPSGASAYLVTVVGQKKMRIPYQNLEIIKQ